MGALNTLRTKGAAVMTGAIAFALLAFLLSDGNFLNSAQHTVVGQIDSQEIDYMNYNNSVENMTFYEQTRMGRNSLEIEHQEQINDAVWQKTVMNELFNSSYVNLGLSISDNEMVDMANGSYISPILKGLFPNEFNQLNREAFSGFISMLNQDPQGNLQNFWLLTEDNMMRERVESKYFDLISKGVYVTDFEAESAVKNNKDKYNIEFVMTKVQPNDSIKVAESELKKYYEKHKNNYISNRVRNIEYVAFEAIPSEEDYNNAKKQFNEMVEEFKTTEDPQQYVNINSEEKSNDKYYSIKNISANYLSIAFPEKGKEAELCYTPELSGNIYTAARVADSKMMSDSITYRVVAVASTENIDSLTTVIKRGGFNKVVKNHSLSENAEDSKPITVNTSDMPDDKLLMAKRGDVVTIDNQTAKFLIYITKADKPIKKVRVANLLYNVKISDKTERDNIDVATLFASEAKDGFEKAVINNALSKRVAKIYPGSKNINNIEGTKELVRWAYSNEPGSVSDVISSGYMVYVTYLESGTDDKYLPFKQVKKQINKRVALQQAIDKDIKELSAYTTLEEAATKLNSEVDTAKDITFASYSIPVIGFAHEILGAIIDLPLDAISKPISTGGGAAIIKVISKEENKASSVDVEKNLVKNLNLTNIQQRIFQSLVSTGNVIDNRILFL